MDIQSIDLFQIPDEYMVLADYVDLQPPAPSALDGRQANVDASAFFPLEQLEAHSAPNNTARSNAQEGEKIQKESSYSLESIFGITKEEPLSDVGDVRPYFPRADLNPIRSEAPLLQHQGSSALPITPGALATALETQGALPLSSHEKDHSVCKICGAPATGLHYRVPSCEACKVFFKRTVQGNIEYKCPNSWSCKVSFKGRKACQACRYQRCISAGMLKEGVRQDRSRGGRQKYYLPRPKGELCQAPDGASILNTLCLLDMEFEPSPLAFPPVEHGSLSAQSAWNMIAEITEWNLRQNVNMLRHLPGLNSYTVEERTNIFRGCWSEMLTFSLIYDSMSTSGLKFAPNFEVSDFLARFLGLEKYFKQVRKVVSKIQKYGGIQKEEYVSLKALILVNVDCGLEDDSVLQILKDRLLSAMEDNIKLLRGEEKVCKHMQFLLLLLPSIREADLTIRSAWETMKAAVPLKNSLLLDMVKENA